MINKAFFANNILNYIRFIVIFKFTLIESVMEQFQHNIDTQQIVSDTKKS